MESSGRILMILGLILLVTGFFLTISAKLPFKLGRLPGDIAYEKNGMSVFIPITTMILLSILFSLVAYVVSRFSR